MLTMKRNSLKKTAIALGTAVAMGGVAAYAPVPISARDETLKPKDWRLNS